jgi:hypothetical protein
MAPLARPGGRVPGDSTSEAAPTVLKDDRGRVDMAPQDVHPNMARLALHERDRRQAVGQVVRLWSPDQAASPGAIPSSTQVVANVGLAATMTIPDDLERLRDRAGRSLGRYGRS